MTNKDYEEFVARGASLAYTDPKFAALALIGEVGEVCDVIKKSIIYTEMEEQDLLGELGDVLWQYVALIQSVGYTLDDIMLSNVRKLNKRHGKKKLDLTGGKR